MYIFYIIVKRYFNRYFLHLVITLYKLVKNVGVAPATSQQQCPTNVVYETCMSPVNRIAILQSRCLSYPNP